jgi:23S rRNA pseudouridine955/2504/2580 synthase
MGHPIIGDDRYGDEGTNQVFRTLGLKRLFLHAQRLSFPHPRTGRAFQIEAPLDVELETFLNHLSS